GWNRTVVPFCGEFDGAGNKITGLWIDRSSQSKPTVGLFGAIDGAEIINLGVKIDDSKGGVSGHGNYGVGGLVGYLKNSSIEDCYTEGPVTSTTDDRSYIFAGGLVGMIEGNDSFIRNCYTTGDVSGKVDVGGLVGGHYGGIIENCYTTGNITGKYNTAGGLVGNSESRECVIRNCYSTGNVISSESSTGGLAGYSEGSMENCYATGDVTVTDTDSDEYDCIGGLVGASSGSIENCYATGNVTATSDIDGEGSSNSIGGLVGNSYGSIENCYVTGNVTVSAPSASGESSHNSIGGLVGYLYGDVESCYAAGVLDATITGSNENVYVGGLVGYYYEDEHEHENEYGADEEPFSGCYFNTETTGQTIGVGNNQSIDGVKGLTTAQMIESDTLTATMSGLGTENWSKRNANDDYCYYPELKVFSEGDDVQMAASEASARLERLVITLDTGSLSTAPITYGDKLSSSTITGNVDASYGGQKINGSLAWSDRSVVPTVKNSGFSMTFTPSSELYKVASITMPVTVKKAILTVTAEDASRIQGMKNSDFSFIYSGYVNGENESALSKKPTISTTADKNSPAGTYDLVVSGGEADNYDFVYVNGTLTVIADTIDTDKSDPATDTAPSTGDSMIITLIILMVASLSLLFVFKQKQR
ncbi:MAG: GLUG motif-containing protein, partial [Sporomusa sp.]